MTTPPDPFRPSDSPYQAPTSPYQVPTSLDEDHNPKGPVGLRGWLILVGFQVVFAPFSVLFVLIMAYLPLFIDGTWESLTTPGTEQFHPFWGPLLVFEIVGNLAFFVASIVLAVLFFRKSRWFPKVYIALMLLNIANTLVDVWLASFVLPNEPMFDPDTMKTLTRSIFGLAIWGSYMLHSKRVKNTFV